MPFALQPTQQAYATQQGAGYGGQDGYGAQSGYGGAASGYGGNAAASASGYGAQGQAAGALPVHHLILYHISCARYAMAFHSASVLLAYIDVHVGT